MSSVTKVTGSPSLTAKSMALMERSMMSSGDQSSASWRIGELPMKVITSTGMPAFWLISTIGAMSLTSVRPAQVGTMSIPCSAISLTSVSTSSNARGPAPGRPTSVLSTPSSSRRCRIASLSPMPGSTTEGFWMPSRRVSSCSSNLRFRMIGPRRSTSFQS